MQITHSKVSEKADGTDPTEILPSDWNDQHVISGLETEITTGTDLNTIQTPGTYYQSSNVNATLALHYPCNLAGVLEVFSSAGIMQRYSSYDNTQVYQRTSYTGVWSNWSKIFPAISEVTTNEIGYKTGSVTLMGGLLIQWGTITITTVNGAVTEGWVTFPSTFNSNPIVTITANTAAPGSNVQEISYTGLTQSGFNAAIYRTGTAAATELSWIAIGQSP